MENCLVQVLQKDVGRRLQVGQEIIDYISDKEKSHDLEQDQTALDKMVDGIASSWVNSSNFKVSCTDKAGGTIARFAHTCVHAATSSGATFVIVVRRGGVLCGLQEIRKSLFWLI